MRTVLLLLAIAGLFPALSSRTADAADAVDFSRDIQPILSENCYFCHGPDADHREADLRLDQQNPAMSVITPGDVHGSELISRITSTDEFELMPPPDSNRKLTSKQIELIKQWIAQGAEWGQHWSFTPIEPVVLPEVDSPEWSENPIDRFVFQKLSEKGMTPSDRASRETLIRRVSLDLTGLPPTIEELDSYLSDTSDEAYEKVVKRLLQSPHYGERMAWNWLDAARYADSNGYQGDRERTMWPWRDWVIRAFNENLPFDKFTVWQVAGDQLPDATFEQKLATGFFRNHMINGEGGRIAEENRIEYVFDMTETLGTVWLGLTFNCCRCHDHKFDPISKEDYYEMFAFFNQTPVTGGGGDPQTAPVIAAPTAVHAEKLAKLNHTLAKTQQEQRDRAEELASEQTEWERGKLDELKSSRQWIPIVPTQAVAEHQTLTIQENGHVLASGPNPNNDTYVLTFPVKPSNVTAVRLDAIQHESMAFGALARSNSGNFVLTEIEFALTQRDATQPVQIASAEATYEQGGLRIDKTFDGNPNTGWAVHEGRPVDRDHAAIFHLSEPLKIDADSQLLITMRHDSPHVHHNLGHFRFSITEAKDPKLTDDSSDLLAALQQGADQRTGQQKKIVRDAFLNSDERYRQLADAAERTQQQIKKLRDSFPRVMVLEDLPQPRKTFALTKGLYNKTEDEVTADTPETLPPLSDSAPRNRLSLANWLVDKENPLTARVTVNRFWQQFFGVGLVKTPEDFGVQGEVPEHLELLNWLAFQFRESDWDVKELVRLIVTSQTYQQSSKSSPERIEQDPENRLLGRGPRYRLPSWMIRDQALAISGLLVAKVGGPPVNGYQPPGIWEEATFGKKTYKQDSGEALYRRSLYTFWRRIVAPTMFFDTASRQTCTVTPIRTNTPLHALVTLNDTTFVEAARAMAQRVMLANHSDEKRVEDAFRLATSRIPTAREREILLERLDALKTQFTEDQDAAMQLITVGESARNQSLEITEHAAWTGVCSLILNLDETLSKQ